VAQVAGNQASKVSKIGGVRKSIARVKTVISQTQRAELRKFYAGKAHQPRDLRAKRTRALRRALSPEEKYAKTERQKKTLAHFPRRRFAVKA
jgi:large subunit ribosomal protein L35e